MSWRQNIDRDLHVVNRSWSDVPKAEHVDDDDDDDDVVLHIGAL